LGILGVVAVAAVLLVVVTGIRAREDASVKLREWTDDQAIPTVAVVLPDPKVLSATIDLPGRLEAYYRAPIFARVNGYLKSWNADIGARVKAGEVIGTGHNERELRADPTAHAEMIALREAARGLGSWRVLDTVLYVTLEPCAMCAGAIVLARVPRVVFGTTDPKAGASGSVLNVLAEPRLNHRPQVESGLLAEDCAELLRAFFASRR